MNSLINYANLLPVLETKNIFYFFLLTSFKTLLVDVTQNLQLSQRKIVWVQLELSYHPESTNGT